MPKRSTASLASFTRFEIKIRGILWEIGEFNPHI